MDDDVVHADMREEQRRDRRHAARKDERVLRLFPDAQPRFQYLLVRAVEARIDEAFGAAGALSGDPFEVALARGGAFEGEGRGEEDRRLQRPFGEHRRSEEHTSELQSLMRTSYAVYCLKTKQT